MDAVNLKLLEATRLDDSELLVPSSEKLLGFKSVILSRMVWGGLRDRMTLLAWTELHCFQLGAGLCFVCLSLSTSQETLLSLVSPASDAPSLPARSDAP